jgi:hypothetical protein
MHVRGAAFLPHRGAIVTVTKHHVLSDGLTALLGDVERLSTFTLERFAVARHRCTSHETRT